MKAQCLCGAVSLETAENRELHACHCGKCRTWAVARLLLWPPGARNHRQRAHRALSASEWAQRCFCKHCGTHLFVQVGNDYYINAGLFADNAGFETTSQIFIDCKAPYYDLANDTPKLTEAEFLEMVGAAG